MPEKNLATLFQNRVYQHAPRQSFLYKKNGQWASLSWEEFGKKVERVALFLLAQGIQFGDRVAIISPNRPEWVIADLAILSIGAVSVPIYPNTAAGQTEYILRHSESKLIFTGSTETSELIESIRAALPTLTKAISLDDVENLESAVRVVEFYHRLSKISPNDLATIVYTSGTTGDPKGVMLSHLNILSNCQASASVFPITQDDLCLSYLPLSHALERTAGFYTMIYIGANIAFSESLAKLASNLAEVKPTVLISVPRILEKIYSTVQSEIAQKSKLSQFLFKKAIQRKLGILTGTGDRLFFRKIRNQLGGRLHYIICGGAAMNPTIGGFFRSVGFEILEGYGLTEASPIVAVNLPNKNKLGTVGPPLPGVEIKLADDGEILVRGPNVMKGYYKDPAETSAAIDDNGFLHTGDVGHIDAEGFLKLTDRKKEFLVTSGGKNIAPIRIENELKSHSLIEQACVIGDGEKFIAALLVPNFSVLGMKAKQNGIAYGDPHELVTNPTVKAWFDSLVDEVNSHLSNYESIRKFVLLGREFSIADEEITPTLKLRRKVITERYKKEIGELFGKSV